jgi:hypothetical protein
LFNEKLKKERVNEKKSPMVARQYSHCTGDVTDCLRRRRTYHHNNYYIGTTRNNHDNLGTTRNHHHNLGATRNNNGTNLRRYSEFFDR